MKKQKIMVCSAVDGEIGKDYYYKYHENENQSFNKKQYVYKFTMENMKRKALIFQINDIIEEDERVIGDIVELKHNEVLCPLLNEHIWKIPTETSQYIVSHTYTELQKEIRRMLKALKIDLYFAKKQKINEHRKKYLFDTFGVEEKTDFQKRTLSDQLKWFEKFNSYDMNFQFMISLYIIKQNLFELIDENVIICNVDKVTLKAECIDEIEQIIESIFKRENASYQMESYVGVDFNDETKELIWGYMSPCEIKVEFSFFWILVKSMLSLAYIPVVILLLQDKNTKIYMYVFLALVYCIAIIFSDEKQVERLVKCRNPLNKELIRYVDLYYFGLIVATTFIFFSIQLAKRIIGSPQSILICLFADILFSYVIILLFNLFISLVAWGITLFNPIRNIREKGNQIYKIVKKVIITIFWLCSLYCTYVVLDIQKYFSKQMEENIGGEFWIFMLCLMMAELKIITVWKKEEVYKEDINIDIQ